jgi:hypothetical protein
MSNITLNALLYAGQGILNGVASFVNRTAGVVNGFSTLTGRVNITDNKKTVVGWKLTLPILVAEDSPCGCAGAVARTSIVDITVRYDRSATAAERADVLKRVQDLVLTTQFAQSVSSLVQPE